MAGYLTATPVASRTAHDRRCLQDEQSSGRAHEHAVPRSATCGSSRAPPRRRCGSRRAREHRLDTVRKQPGDAVGAVTPSPQTSPHGTSRWGPVARSSGAGRRAAARCVLRHAGACTARRPWQVGTRRRGPGLRRRPRRGGRRRGRGCRARSPATTWPRRRRPGRHPGATPATPDCDRLRGHGDRDRLGRCRPATRPADRARPVPVARRLTWVASARAATRNISSVMVRRLGHHRAEPHAREDEDVVGLADRSRSVLPRHRREGAAGGDDGASVAPGEHVGRLSLRPGSTGWRGEDDRLLGRIGHGADDVLVERARLSGGADEDVGAAPPG